MRAKILEGQGQLQEVLHKMFHEEITSKTQPAKGRHLPQAVGVNEKDLFFIQHKGDRMKKTKKLFKPIPGYISGIKSMAKGWRITLDTQEDLKTEHVADIASLRDKYGWLYFFHDEVQPKIEDIEVPEGHVKSQEVGDKSPSQRLRAVMFIYWKANQVKMNLPENFNHFYENQIESYINAWKERLPI